MDAVVQHAGGVHPEVKGRAAVAPAVDVHPDAVRGHVAIAAGQAARDGRAHLLAVDRHVKRVLVVEHPDLGALAGGCSLVGIVLGEAIGGDGCRPGQVVELAVEDDGARGAHGVKARAVLSGDRLPPHEDEHDDEERDGSGHGGGAVRVSSSAMALTARLAELVAFDTQNPMGNEAPIIKKLAADLTMLGASLVEVADVGLHGYVFARFGTGPAPLLLNAHVDTVPANTGYTAPPHELRQRETRLHGLGAADTKGAIAAILEALQSGRPQGVAVLFSGDEERTGTALRAFLASERARGIQHAIVCEPTGCAVGRRHRGIGAVSVVARGPGGHSSRVDSVANPMAILARGAVALDHFALERRNLGPPGFEGLCLNVAAINGGIAFNVIPTEATLLFSLRPAPGTDMGELLGETERRVRLATAPHPVDWRVMASRPAFETREMAPFERLLGERARAPVDLAFWTEAALFAESGIDAVVLGPGRIEQAHAADEYVELGELEEAQALFEQVLARAAG
jgi:acetylornithine deacetylase